MCFDCTPFMPSYLLGIFAASQAPKRRDGDSCLDQMGRGGDVAIFSVLSIVIGDPQ